MAGKQAESGKLGIPLHEVLTKPWMQLNSLLLLLEESELKRLIDLERKGANRLTVLLRVHARFNKVRAAREREALRRG